MLRSWTALVLFVVVGCSGTADAGPDRLRDAAATEAIEYLREIERRTPSEPPIEYTGAVPAPARRAGRLR